jgi:phospholipid/cholesterol/gamma-HCH transport system substrate-binding protein
MENKSHALAAGAFVLLIAALLVAMVMWLTRDKSDQLNFELVTRDAVSGLQPQAGVRYKGVLVGRVQEIELDPEVKGQIRIQIAVDKHTPVTTSTFATLGFQGVTGLSFIQLDDTGESNQNLATDDDHLARIPLRAGLVSRLTDQGGNLLEKVDLITQNINALINPENQKILIGSVKDIGQAAASINQLAKQADAVLAQQTKAEQLNLPRIAAQTEATLKSIQTSSERLGESLDAVRISATEFKRTATRMGEAGGTLDKLEQSSEVMQFTAQSIHSNLMPHINRTAENSVYTLRQLSRIADDVTNSPQLLLWGKEATPPGPGEKGFSSSSLN